MLFPSLEEFDAYERGESTSYGYGRNGNPTITALADAIAEIEGADATYLFPSGLSAIVTALVAYTKAGDHILVADNVYSPTRKYCDHELSRFGVETSYFSPDAGANLEELVRENTSVIFLESPGSLTFEMQDIRAIAEICKRHDIILMSDNTWATPLYMDAFALGVDVSIQSATKYIAGHSDLCMGALSVKDKHNAPLKRAYRHLGNGPSSDECYLALRGLRTMALRLPNHERAALELAEWLKSFDEVAQILHPALPEHPGHALWKRDMTGSCGLFSFVFDSCTDKQLTAFIDGLEHFGLGYSWGGYESLIIPFRPAKLRSASDWDKDTVCIRLHVGLEHMDDLKHDLSEAFTRMRKAA
ncbi:MAG: cystathionine beta-lyase [Rickettsiales bacterium]|nr:cystathionine beta-lyase [Rickettsiales bacterium]